MKVYNMDKNIKPISPSEYWVWKNKKEDYYDKYILNKNDFEVTDKMMFGIATHKAFEGENWIEYALENLSETDMCAIQSFFSYDLPDIPEKEMWLGKYGKVYTETGCRLSGRADGVDTKNHIIYEIKTSDYHWNEWLADRNDALTHYSFLYYDVYGVLPELKVISCSRKKGDIRIIKTQRNWEEIQYYLSNLNTMVSELKKRGWFEERKSTYKQ